MDSVGYLRILRRRWLTVVFTTVLVALLASAYTLRLTPQYRATASLFYSVTTSGSATDLVQGSAYTQEVVKSYTNVATSPLVLEPVIDRLDLDTTAGRLASQVTATVSLDTVIIDLSVAGTDPQQTTRVANAIADELRSTSERLSPTSGRNRSAIDVTVIRPATVPTAPFSPDLRLYAAGGLVVGLLLGIGLAVFRERLSARVRTDDDVAQLSDAPVLAHIPRDRSWRIEPALTGKLAHGPRSEAVRRLRINLDSLGLRDDSVLLVTSGLPGEGKSTTAVDLALALTESSQRVLLIDADLRRPRVARYLGLEQSIGLTTVLSGDLALEDAVQPWRRDNLHVLTSGDVSPHPSRLLGSQQMRNLLRRSRERYDTVLVDGAPLLPVADSTELSKIVDGTLLVVDTRRLRTSELARALATLSNAGSRLTGIVLNKAPRTRHSQYHYSYASSTPWNRRWARLWDRDRRRDEAYRVAREETLDRDEEDSRPRVDARDG